MTDMKLVEHRATRRRDLDSVEKLRADRARVSFYSSEKLRQARIKADFPQAVVANALGVKLDLVREWERGQKVPAGPSILRLMILYGIEAADLLDETEASRKE